MKRRPPGSSRHRAAVTAPGGALEAGPEAPADAEPAGGRSPAGVTRADPWRDPSLPVADRVSDLLARMTLAEKVAQLGSVWLSGPADADGVAPLQGEFAEDMPQLDELIRDGLGQL